MAESLDKRPPSAEGGEILQIESDYEAGEGERLSPAGVLGNALEAVQQRWESFHSKMAARSGERPSIIGRVERVADKLAKDMRERWDSLREQIEGQGESFFPISDPEVRKQWALVHIGLAGAGSPFGECMTAEDAARIFGPSAEVPTGRLAGIPEMTDARFLAEIPEDAHRIRADRIWEESPDGNKLRKIEYKPMEGDYPVLIAILDENGNPTGFRVRTIRVIEGVEVPVEEDFDRDHVPVELAQMMGWTLEMEQSP